MLPSRSLLPFAMAALACALPAQLRHPCLGTVVDADDRPLADAEVTMVWTPSAGRPGELDVVRATTDARGRFKVDLVISRAYSAWAIGLADADGSRLVSEVTDRAAAGVVLQIAAWHRWRPRQLQCSGHEPWVGAGPVRLRWYCDSRNDLGVDLPPATDGRVALPPGPWIDGSIALLDSDGGLVNLSPVKADVAEPTVTFAAPQESTLEVVDVHEKPVAGAVVEQMVTQWGGGGGDAIFPPFAGHRWSVAGKTDAAGRARLRIVSVQHVPACWLRIGAGPATCYTVDENNGTAARRVVVCDVAMEAGAVRGIRADEVPFAQVSTTAVFEGTGRSHGLGLWPALSVAADGRLGMAPVPVPTAESTLLLQLFPQREGTPRHVVNARRREPAHRLPTLDLDELRTIRVRAVDDHNNPLPGAAVMVVSTEEMSQRDSGMQLVLDHGGRADLLLDESEWGVYVTTGTAHALEFVDAGTEGGELLLRLQPMPRLRCHVVDANGKPVQHARVESKSGGGFSGVLRGRRGWTKERLAARVAFTSAAAARSDRDGMLVVPVQDWRPMSLQVQVRAGAMVSAPMPLAVREDVVEVVVR